MQSLVQGPAQRAALQQEQQRYDDGQERQDRQEAATQSRQDEMDDRYTQEWERNDSRYTQEWERNDSRYQGSLLAGQQQQAADTASSQAEGARKQGVADSKARQQTRADEASTIASMEGARELGRKRIDRRQALAAEQASRFEGFSPTDPVQALIGLSVLGKGGSQAELLAVLEQSFDPKEMARQGVSKEAAQVALTRVDAEARALIAQDSMTPAEEARLANLEGQLAYAQQHLSGIAPLPIENFGGHASAKEQALYKALIQRRREYHGVAEEESLAGALPRAGEEGEVSPEDLSALEETLVAEGFAASKEAPTTGDYASAADALPTEVNLSEEEQVQMGNDLLKAFDPEEYQRRSQASNVLDLAIPRASEEVQGLLDSLAAVSKQSANLEHAAGALAKGRSNVKHFPALPTGPTPVQKALQEKQDKLEEGLMQQIEPLRNMVEAAGRAPSLPGTKETEAARGVVLEEAASILEAFNKMFPPI